MNPRSTLDQYFTETLPCGGKLVVYLHRWKIDYVYLHEDARRNAEFFSIAGSEVPLGIEQIQMAFQLHQQMEESTPVEASLTLEIAGNMVVYIGRYLSGVALTRRTHLSIIKKCDKDKVIDSWRYACRRSAEIQEWMRLIITE
jgi:hypothetical protein